MHSPLADMRILEYARSTAPRFCGWLVARMGGQVMIPADRAEPDEPAGGFFSGWLDTGKVRADWAAGAAGLDAVLAAAPERLDAVVVDLPAGSDPAELAAIAAAHGTNLLTITPFGLEGGTDVPPGGDLISSHSSGYAYYLAASRPDLPPARGPEGQAPLFAGLVGAAAIVSSALALRQGAPGRLIDLSEQEASASLLFQELNEYNLGTLSHERDFEGSTSAGGLVGFLPTTDGAVLLSPREQHQWSRLIEVVGNPTWAADPQYAKASDRISNWPALQRLLGEWSSVRTKENVAKELQAAQIACFPVNQLSEVLTLGVLEDREYWEAVPAPAATGRDEPGGAAAVRMPGIPFHLSPAPVAPAESSAESPADRHRRDDDLPLSGLRVIDFSWVVGGPVCTRLLSLLGADVIKIESRTRPEHRKRKAAEDLLNISKRSLGVNLKTPEGVELVGRLIGASDAVVENFSVGVLDRLGLGWEAMAARNPRLVMLSMSGLGRSGSGARLLAYGSLLQGYAGWMAEMGQPQPGKAILGARPMGIRPAWTDQSAGTAGALAVLVALWNRDRTGGGAYIDLSMLEALLMTQASGLARLQTVPPAGKQPWRPNQSTLAAPNGCYPCSEPDTWVAVSVRTPEEWAGLAGVLGRADLAAYETLEARLAHAGLLDEAVSAWTRERTAAEAAELLRRAGVPSAMTQNLWSLLDDPRFMGRELFTPTSAGQLVIGTPWLDSQHRRGRIERSPEVGEHTAEILTGVLGLSEAEVAELVDREVLT